MLLPVTVQVYEGFPVTLNWSYDLSVGLGLGGFIRFKQDGIASIAGDGSAGAVAAQDQKRFNISSSLGRVSLFISPVTVTDDEANGEFSCVLIDSNNDIWKRAIRVKVIGKLESVVDYEKGVR